MFNHIYDITIKDMNETHFIELVKFLKKIEQKSSKFLARNSDEFISYDTYKNRMSKLSQSRSIEGQSFVARSWLNAFYNNYLMSKEMNEDLSRNLHSFDYDKLYYNEPGISLYGSRFIIKKDSEFNDEMKFVNSEIGRPVIEIIEGEETVLRVYTLDRIDKNLTNMAIVVNPAFGISINKVFISDRKLDYDILEHNKHIPLYSDYVIKQNEALFRPAKTNTETALISFINFLVESETKYLFFLNNIKIYAYIPSSKTNDYIEDRFIKIHKTYYITDIIYAYCDMVGAKPYELKKDLRYVDGLCSRCKTFNHKINKNDKVFICEHCKLKVDKNVNMAMNLLVKFNYRNSDTFSKQGIMKRTTMDFYDLTERF